MPRLSYQTFNGYWEPDACGPIAQVELSMQWSPDGALPLAPIAKATPFDTGMIYADGFKVFTVGVKMDQAGTLSVQRYLDAAGLLPVGAAIQAAIVAGQPAVLANSDNYPFCYIRATITNAGTPPANVAAFALILNAN